MASQALINEVERTVAVYEDIIGRTPSRTWQMIESHGHIEALSRLVGSGDLQSGFKKLRDANKLDCSFEAVIVRFAGEFRDDVVAAAQFRLDHPHDLQE